MWQKIREQGSKLIALLPETITALVVVSAIFFVGVWVSGLQPYLWNSRAFDVDLPVVKIQCHQPPPPTQVFENCYPQAVSGLLPSLWNPRALVIEPSSLWTQCPHTPSSTQLKSCTAKAITGNTLIFNCDQSHAPDVVTLDSIITLPLSHTFGVITRDMLNDIIHSDKQSDGTHASDSPRIAIFYDATSGYHYEIGGLDLRLLLLESGLADLCDEEQAEEKLKAARNRAQAARLGLWWDWPRGEGKDAINWRIERDLALASVESAHADRAQAFSNFFSGTLSGLIGFLTGYWLQKKQTDQKRGQRLHNMKGALEGEETALGNAIDKLGGACSEKDPNREDILLHWSNFDEMYQSTRRIFRQYENEVWREIASEDEQSDVKKRRGYLRQIKRLHEKIQKAVQAPKFGSDVSGVAKEVRTAIDVHRRIVSK
jgi:hypothetical protein